MLKTFQSSFPPFPNLVKTNFDKLNNTDLFFNYRAIYRQSPIFQLQLKAYYIKVESSALHKGAYIKRCPVLGSTFIVKNR